MWWPSVTLLVLLVGVYAQHIEYQVPEPKLEALWPTGIRVSIRDSPGVELFAFHGSVNKPLRFLAAGDMSRDILTKTGGLWVFEDLDVQLKPGDVVYYWLYVQVHGRGYQRTNLYWIVESFVSDNTSSSPTPIPLPQGTYKVPEALVEPLHPRGLRVSIPDSPGMQIFAFHGNVNKLMRPLEAGSLSQDVINATDGRWIFEDPDVQLRKGDTIYYWTYVIRNGLGYRRDNERFVVTELFPAIPAVNTTTEAPKLPDKEMKEVKLPEGLEFKVTVKDGKLQLTPIIPEDYVRSGE